MIPLLSVVAVIVATFALSVLVERVLGRSRKEMVKPGWYVVFFAVFVPALLLVYSTVSVASPVLYAAYALAGGVAALIAQCLFGARLGSAQSQSKGGGGEV